jgi:hypothetical protein
MTQKEDFEGRGFFTRLRAAKLSVATFPEIRYCREIVRGIAGEASSSDGAPFGDLFRCVSRVRGANRSRGERLAFDRID